MSNTEKLTWRQLKEFANSLTEEQLNLTVIWIDEEKNIGEIIDAECLQEDFADYGDGLKPATAYLYKEVPYAGIEFTEGTPMLYVSRLFYPTGSIKNKLVMNSLLYILAIILLIGWAIGFFAYGASGIIHILLVLAIIAVLLNVIRNSPFD